jgi:hypothetical protein
VPAAVSSFVPARGETLKVRSLVAAANLTVDPPKQIASSSAWS